MFERGRSSSAAVSGDESEDEFDRFAARRDHQWADYERLREEVNRLPSVVGPPRRSPAAALATSQGGGRQGGRRLQRGGDDDGEKNHDNNNGTSHAPRSRAPVYVDVSPKCPNVAQQSSCRDGSYDDDDGANRACESRPLEDVSPQGRGPNVGMYRMYDPLVELRSQIPFLSTEFECSNNDALLLLGAISTKIHSKRHVGSLSSSPGSFSNNSPLEDRLAAVEAEKRALETRLDRRSEECERLRDELAEARQKLRAVQQQASQSAQLLSQRREDLRKQLILEEGRTQKVQLQNKLLTQEIDKLRERVHHLTMAR